MAGHQRQVGGAGWGFEEVSRAGFVAAARGQDVGGGEGCHAGYCCWAAVE